MLYVFSCREHALGSGSGPTNGVILAVYACTIVTARHFIWRFCSAKPLHHQSVCHRQNPDTADCEGTAYRHRGRFSFPNQPVFSALGFAQMREYARLRGTTRVKSTRSRSKKTPSPRLSQGRMGRGSSPAFPFRDPESQRCGCATIAGALQLDVRPTNAVAIQCPGCADGLPSYCGKGETPELPATSSHRSAA